MTGIMSARNNKKNQQGFVEHGNDNNTSRGRASSFGDTSPGGTSWLFEDEGNMLDYFLGGDHGATLLPPTPEGESLSVATGANTMPLHQTFAGSGPPSSSHVFVPHQQNSNAKQRNIRFPINNDQSINNSIGSSNHRFPAASTAKVKTMQPPPTPAVQHFYSRPSTTKTTITTTTTTTQTRRNGAPSQYPPIQPNNTLTNTMPNFPQPAPVHQSLSNKQTRPVSMLYSTGQHIPPSTTSMSSVSPNFFQSTTGLSPEGQMHQPFQVPNPHTQTSAQGSTGNSNGISPISPATMCTSEVMIFPPPGGYAPTQTNPGNQTRIVQPNQWQGTHPTHPSSNVQNSQPNDNKLSQNHMANASWLQHLNNITMNTIAIKANGNNPISVKHDTNTSVTNSDMVPSRQTAYFNNAASHINDTSNPSQQNYATTMSLSQGPFNADILPVPSTTNHMLLSSAALHHFASTISGPSTGNTVETKEKRERRLARNRESARQSRRRKKDLLINVESQVSKLNGDIEYERSRQLNLMENQLRVSKSTIIMEARRCLMNGNMNMVGENLDMAIRNGGPNISIRRAAAEFQYNSLRQLILPLYQRFILSMSLRQESFFIGSKEKKSKLHKGTGRISSKLVGEDIQTAEKNKSYENTNLTCGANDHERLWPLLCYELTVSLDQEERLLQAFKRMRDNEIMPQNRSQVAVSLTMVSSLRDGILRQFHSAAHRNEIGLLQVLTQSQAIAFLDWFVGNKDRCNNLFNMDRNQSHFKDYNNEIDQRDEHLNKSECGGMKASKSLSDICNLLTDAMMIAKSDL